MNLRSSSTLACLSSLLLTLQLSGCSGGGGGGGSAATDTGTAAAPATSTATTSAPPAAPVPASTTTLEITKAEFAQTHVLPDGIINWRITDAAGALTATGSLSLIGSRDALALIDLAQTNVVNPVLEAWQGSTKLGSVALKAPNTLPRTEDNGPTYSTTAWNAVMPAAWVVPGVSIKVSSSNLATSAARSVTVGADSEMTLKILPFYLFGANDTNTGTVSADIAAPNAAIKQELFAKWPVAKLNAINHELHRVDLSSLVIPPGVSNANNSLGLAAGIPQPAYVMTSMNQQRNSWDVMGAVLTMIGQIRAANGEGSTSNQYYAPILGLNTAATGTNKLAFLGGGLGSVGGGTGVGDQTYGGVFIHEQGHAFGLGHVGTEYTNGTYPYPGGSLSGSAWGYDPFHNEFLSPYVPSSAYYYPNCLNNTSRQPPVNGRCIKQDPMQGGSGDQASGYKYATFSDYSTGRMQKWFEGTTTINASGAHAYSGGRIFEDSNSATGYSRWDSILNARVPVTPSTQDGGLYGTNGGLPISKNVPVYAIAITMSYAGTPGASQIAPPMPFTGNLLKQFDPSNPTDLADFQINTGKYYWYCVGSGCDYTLRVTYADNSVIYRTLQGGFRAWWSPRNPPNAAASDPLSGSSFKSWVINVPGGQNITKVELLDTPQAWSLTPAAIAAAPVLLTR